MTESSMVALVTTARSGEHEAFHGLVLRYQDMAVAHAYARVGSLELAREVAQEAFLDAWVHLHQLREPAAFVAWLRRIVVKHADRITRRVRPPTTEVEGVPSTGASPLDAVAVSQIRARVDAAVAALPEHERVVVSLFYLSGQSVREVADFLDLKVGTVKKRLHSARARLAQETAMTELIRDTLHAERPSRDDSLARAIRFFVAARVGDEATVRDLIAEAPELTAAVQPADEGSRHHYMATGGEGRYTALHLSANNGLLGVVCALLEAGADPNAAARGGITPLHCAVQVDELEVARALLVAGADPDASTGNGVCALHMAAMRGYVGVTRALLAAGADPALLDLCGRSPADWARRSGEPELAELLGVVLDAPEPPAASAEGEVWWTGIKAIDLLAPLPRRGLVRLVGAHGVGMVVLLGELMDRVRRRDGGRAAFGAVATRAYDPVEFPPIVRELGTHGHTEVAVARGGAAQAEVVALVRTLRDSGASLLVLDHDLARVPGALDGELDQLVVAFEGWERRADAADLPPLPEPDVTLVLSAALAKRGLYPALDPARSRSRRADDAVAREARAALCADPLSPRAERLQAYLTQPFHVAEPFTALPAAHVDPAHTRADVARILAGELDAVEPAELRYLAALPPVEQLDP